MKKITIILSFLMIFTFAFSGSAFAGEAANVDYNYDTPAVSNTVSAYHAVPAAAVKSNGLSASAYRVNSNYLRVTFTNSTNSKITDTVNVADAVYAGEHISGPFSISVPARSSRSYDVYVGGYHGAYVITGSHGYFYFDL
jgi:hypothetical protein